MLNVNSNRCAKKLKLSQSTNTLGSLSLLGLVVVGLGLVCPVVSYGELAEALVLEHREVPAATLSLALDSANEIDITPSGEGQFGAVSTKLQVTATSNSGYQVYLNTLDGTNAMVGTKGEIKALVSPSSSTSFPTNTWGYALGTMQAGPETEYQDLPLTPTVVHNTDHATAGTVDTYYLSFGTNIDTSLPAGQYTNNVAVSVIANPQRITNLSELTYMQDMTSSICTNTKGANNSHQQDATGSYVITPGNEVEKRLIDSRDGKEYWVAKLADGNCWMTQNLALDLEPGKKLTSGDTDLNSKETWTVLTSAELVDTVKVSDSVNYAWPTEDTATGFPVSSEYYSTRSWSLGNEYVMVDLEGKFSCLTNEGFSCKRFSKKSSLSSYDEHFVVGSFYQYNTAAAGSAGAKVFSEDLNDVGWLKDVEDSICPRGWTLPASGRNSIINEGWPYDRAKSFYRLFYAYGYPKTGKAVIGSTDAETELLAQTNWIIYKYGAFTQIKNTDINGASQNPNKLPMSFVDGGHFDSSANSVVNAGIYGQYWSSTLAGSSAAFDYVNSKGSIRPANVDGRYLGFSVRCLAR